MIKIYIIADSFKHFQSAIDEYTKRLGKKLQIIKIKPSKNGTPLQIIEKDTQQIKKYLEKSDSLNVLLSLEGKQLTSEDFANKIISKTFNQGQKISFFIGGAFGLDEKQLPNIDLKLKLSEFTLPHALALLTLTEQIYRSFQILENKNYHY